jgi:acetyl esterase/lipase
MRYRRSLTFIFFLLMVCQVQVIFAQKVMDLYAGAIPNSIQGADNATLREGVATRVSRPTLTIFLPVKEKATGTAVVICPGGGYGALMMQKEGFNIASYFQEHGVAAFVLKYRLPDSAIMPDKSIGPLQDAQQAIKLVRDHAREWGIDIKHVGIMGFSAGGHLAATASTHFLKPVIPNPENTNLRPDFSMLVYPVVSFSDSLAHAGSRKNLIGSHPSNDLVRLFSNEQQVTAQTPPAFLIHAADDNVVDVDNSISYFEALRHNKVPAELHIYPKGNHGFVLNIPIEDWMSLCMKWMKSNGW